MAMPPSPSDWFHDGRDGFISWIRGEFAAANAIIDSLCQHLVAIGDHNEYEAVVSAVQRRQGSWSHVLYMQQFNSVADVSYSLHQAAWKRQQGRSHSHHHGQRRYGSDQVGGRRSGYGFNKHHHHGGGGGGGGYRGGESMVRNGSDCDKVEAKVESDEKALSVVEEKRDGNEKPKSGHKDLEESESAGAETGKHDCNSASKDINLSSEEKQEEKECPVSMARTFIVQEMYEAKLVNVVEGLKLYEKIVDVNEVSQLVSIANNLRNAGRRGQLQSEGYVVYKRPNRGHGREMIQLGLPIADTMPDDESIKDRRIEPIPLFLSDIIERLVSKQIIPVKPDACIIDFFSEGDHSQPHMFVPWFGRPVGILSLSECDFTFGRVIVSDHPGDYKGSLKLSLTPGSLLLVEGNSADLAKFAIDSIRKQRILITLTKYQPRSSINWGPPPSRSPPNHHNRQPTGPPKHYPVIPATGVLPTPSNNGAVQPIFIPPSPPLASPMRGIPPGATSWPQPRVHNPGTGVFLPPGSAQGSTEKPNNSNGSNSAEGKIEMKTKEEEVCNTSNAANEGEQIK